MRRQSKVLLAIAVVCSFFTIAVGSASADYAFKGTFAGPRGEGAPCPEPAPGALCTPGRAAVEQSTGNLFVVDSGNERVQVFAPNDSGSADYLTEFGGGELSAPWGIAIDEDADQTSVYVADAGNEEIVKYDSDEQGTPSFTLDPGFTSPAKGSGAGQIEDFHAALAIDPTTHELLVADNANKRIARFEADGTPDGSFDGSEGSGSPGAFAGPIDVAVNSAGDVYVIDANGPDIRKREGTSQVLRYSSTGGYKATLGPVGTHERPATVAVNPETDEVVVSGDQDNVYEDGPPPFVAAIQLFDSANNPTSSPALNEGGLYDTVSGLAVVSGVPSGLFVVLDVGYFNAETYGSPQIQAFATLLPPAATIDAVDPLAVTATGASFSGTVNPNGRSAEWHFEYSADEGVHWESTPTASAGAGDLPVSVSADVDELAPGHPYRVRLVASNADGTTSAGPVNFQTESSAPLVKTLSPNQVDSDAAWLRGSVDPAGLPTTYYFEYGLDSSYGSRLPSEANLSAGSGSEQRVVSEWLQGLQKGTTYHYRIVAVNAKGTVRGDDLSFSTSASCPNGEIRVAQGADYLADCRAYEQISPVDKLGADVSLGSASVRGALTGDGVAFDSNGVFQPTEGTGSGGLSTYLARRNPTGWSLNGLTPQQSPYALSAASGSLYQYLSADLTKGVVLAFNPPLAPGAPENILNLYLRADTAKPSYETLTTSVNSIEADIGIAPGFADATPDFNHIVFQSSRKLTADAPEPEYELYSLYQWDRGSGLHLVGILPDSEGGGTALEGSRPATATGCASGNPDATHNYTGGGNTISPDGNRVFFSSGGRLYMRDSAGSKTTFINASENTTEVVSPMGASFCGTASAGTEALFTSEQPLVDGDTDTSRDLYRYVIDAPPGEHLSRLSVDQEPADGSESRIEGVLGISADGQTVYFVATGRLVPGQPEVSPGTLSLYVWDHGVVKFITGIGDDRRNWAADPILLPKVSRMTPDGRHLLFQTGTAQKDGPGQAGPAQFYLYDADTEQSPACVSCRLDGELPSSEARIGLVRRGSSSYSALPRALSKDGRRVFFDTADPLVPGDSNGKRDVYEWENGRLHLISSGVGSDDSYFGDASEDASDVFFLTRDQLVGNDVDHSLDLYDARVNGGFPEALPPSPGCEGEACQPPQAIVNESTPASSAFRGPGNVHSRGTRCAKGHHRVRRSGRVRCVRNGAGKRRTVKQKRSSRNRAAGSNGRAGK